MIVQTLRKIFFGVLVTGFVSSAAETTEDCSSKLFNVTINDQVSIGDAIDNLAQTCGLTVVVRDSGAQHRLQKKLYYVKLRNATLKSFLDTILKDNDLNYRLRGNKLSISYLITRTYKVHYVTGTRTGNSKSNVDISGSSSSSSSTGGSSGGSSGSNTNIETSNEFKFWITIKKEIQQILNTAGDDNPHFTSVGGKAWIGPDGKKWDRNPLEPVVNPEAGLVTVTGTARQIERVSRYISTLMHQIKTQVMIDVRILSVHLSEEKRTGIDWTKIYNDLALGVSFDGGFGAGNTQLPTGTYNFSFGGSLGELLHFLKSQGDVTTVSNPKVMTLNNQPALISVGKDIYYKLKTSTSGTSGETTSESDTINSVFAGVLLDITPEVDERGIVTLKINPSITNVADNTVLRTDMPPNLERRQIAAVIKVRDGDHAVLGGLITKSKGSNVEKIPLLGDIPILGSAFKKHVSTNTSDELVIIITPHIIKRNRNISLKELGYKTLR